MQLQSGKHKSGVAASCTCSSPWPSLACFGCWHWSFSGTLPAWLLCSWLFTAQLQPVMAVEFGDTSVTSYIGQPLVAEVELLALTPEEQDALQVKPANLDVYRGANIKYQPLISNLRWVVQRRGQRQFLRISSAQPVRASFLNLFLEMGVKGDMSVRALTLFLETAPDTVASAQDGLADTQNEQAADETADPGITAALETPANQFELPAKRPQPSGLCSGGGRCAAVDRQNRQITRQITELEKNVGALRQVIVGAASASASAGATATAESTSGSTASADTPVSDAAPADGELFLKKEEPIIPKKPVPKATPWKLIAMIAAGVLALLLAGLLLYRRSRRGKKPVNKKKPENKPGNKASWWARLREKWRKRKSGNQSGADVANDIANEVANAGESGTGAADAGAGHDEAAVPDDGKKTGRVKAMLASLRERWQGLAERLKQVFARGKKKPAPEAAPAVEGEDG